MAAPAALGYDETSSDTESELDEVAILNSDDILLEIHDDDGDYAPAGSDNEDETAVASTHAENLTPTKDTSLLHFSQHGASVFSVSSHPSKPIAVSGGQDNFGYIWNTETGEQLSRLSGHSDSVVQCAFNFDGSLVALGSLDGHVRVWRAVKRDTTGKLWEFMTDISGPDEVIWIEWHPRGSVLLAGGSDSTVWLWQLPFGKTMQVFSGHDGAVQCGTFTPDGRRTLTADEYGNLLFCDPRQSEPVWKISASADARFAMESGITSVAINPSSSIAAIGSAGGNIRVVNLTKGIIIGGLEGHENGQSIEALAFLDFGLDAAMGHSSGILASAGTDGRICLWDLSSMKQRTTLTHLDAVTTLLPHRSPNAHLLTSTSVDRTVRTWDARSGRLLRENTGHSGPIFDAAIVNDGRQVVTASEDGYCAVFPLDTVAAS